MTRREIDGGVVMNINDTEIHGLVHPNLEIVIENIIGGEDHQVEVLYYLETCIPSYQQSTRIVTIPIIIAFQYW